MKWPAVSLCVIYEVCVMSVCFAEGGSGMQVSY